MRAYLAAATMNLVAPHADADVFQKSSCEGSVWMMSSVMSACGTILTYSGLRVACHGLAMSEESGCTQPQQTGATAANAGRSEVRARERERESETERETHRACSGGRA